MKKGVLGLLILVLLVLGAGGYFAKMTIERVVTAAVEDVGRDASGQPFALTSPKFSFARGKGTDLQLRLVQDGGFLPEAPFKFDEVKVQMDVAAVLANPITIHQMTVWSPYVTYGGSQDGETEVAGGQNAAFGSAEERNYVIETLYFRDGVLLLSAPSLLGRDIPMKLPDMEMHGVGPGSNQATPGELIRQTVDKALEGVAGDSEDMVDRIEESLEEMSEELAAQAEIWREKLGEAADKASQAIKDLLKNGDD